MEIWVFCSNLWPEFRSGLQPGFCLSPRWEFGPCSLGDFKSNSKSDLVLSPCLSLRHAPYSAACARQGVHFSHKNLCLALGPGLPGGNSFQPISGPWPHLALLVRELGMETRALPWLLAPYLSAFGKFSFLSNFSPCCCPAALISFLLVLGNLGVDLLSAPLGDCASGGQPGWVDWESLPLLSHSRAEGPPRWAGSLQCTQAHLPRLVLLGPPWAPCWPPPDFWPGLRPGGALSPWPGGADRRQMGGSAVCWVQDGHRAVRGAVWG